MNASRGAGRIGVCWLAIAWIGLVAGCQRRTPGDTQIGGCDANEDCSAGESCDPGTQVCVQSAPGNAGGPGASMAGSPGIAGAPGAAGAATAGSDAGGSGGTTGGSGAAGSPSPAAGSSGGPSSGNTEVVDDLEDNDGRIAESMGRKGSWHIFNDQENGGNQEPPLASFAPEMGGAASTMYAVHTSGEGYMFAGVGFDLNNADAAAETPNSMPFDASAWDGIAFYAKGTASLRLEIPTRNFVPADRGGTCSDDCWNVYGYRLSEPLGPDWREYRVPFAMMEREMGGMDPALDRSQLMSISFKHEGTARFDFWVDEIRFYRD